MKNNKCLLFYINAIHDGGAERVIIQLAYQFALCGYHSVLVTSFVDNNEYPVPEIVKRISLEEKEIKQSALGRNFTRIIKLRKICKKYKPSALISFMVEPCFRALIATIGLPIKNVVSVRNDPGRDYRGGIRTIVGKYLMPMADGCVFQTEDAKAWFPDKLQKKSRVILNPVDHVFFEQEWNKRGRTIVSLGRLARQKNQKLLIEAFSKIAQKYQDVVLKIYGIGPLEEELRETIRSCGLESQVYLAGLTNSAQTVLSEAELFVLSSDYEGMPNALMEALAVGVPSISTDCPCGGPRTLIENQKNGILIPVGDTRALSSAMDQLLSNRQLAEKIGMEAKKKAREYETEVIFEQWRTFIEAVIKH